MRCEKAGPTNNTVRPDCGEIGPQSNETVSCRLNVTYEVEFNHDETVHVRRRGTRDTEVTLERTAMSLVPFRSVTARNR